MKKNTFKRIVTVGAVLAGVAVFIASILNKRENENEEYCTPKALRKAAKNQATFYEKYVKRGLDILLSLFAYRVINKGFLYQHISCICNVF